MAKVNNEPTTTTERPLNKHERAGLLAQAVINCMYDIDNIDKNTTVGKGGNAYKGVSDKDVKIATRKAMAKNGLIILPIGVTTKTEVTVYQAPDPYNPGTTQRKQQIFTEVHSRYKLMHVSGAFEILEGVGHGVDNLDKAAGKATTYALKYALLYMFLIPSGQIDDTDRMHSDEGDVPPADAATTREEPKEPMAKVEEKPKEEPKKQQIETLPEPPKDATCDAECPAGKVLLNNNRFRGFLDRVRKGESGLIGMIEEKMHCTPEQVEYLRANIPTLDEVKKMEQDKLPATKEAAFRGMLKAYKAGKADAVEEMRKTNSFTEEQEAKIVTYTKAFYTDGK